MVTVYFLSNKEGAVAHALGRFFGKTKAALRLEFISTKEFKKNKKLIVARILAGGSSKLLVTYNFGYILPSILVNNIMGLNIHFSLLPQYRGPLPTIATILNQEKVTGITVHRLTEHVDAGDIFMQVGYKIKYPITAGQLFKTLEQHLISDVLPYLVEAIAKGLVFNEANYFVQNGEVSYAPFYLRKKQNAKVSFKKMTAIEILHRVLAFNPEPVAFTFFKVSGKKRMVNLYSVSVINEVRLKPGEVMFSKQHRRLLVGSLLGAVSLEEIAIEGKKRLYGEQIGSIRDRIRV